jgi:hypothetical protein
MGKIITIGLGLFLMGIFVPMYWSSWTSANTTGMPTMMTQLGGNYLPLIGMVAVLIVIISVGFSFRKKD